MTDRFPQLKGFRVTHAWTGDVAFRWDALSHYQHARGMHYALGCNGIGVAMMTYLGRETARRIVGGANSTCWALPAVGACYRFRDGLSRALAKYA
jgi:glycine/D-amino acid oxidase-like deaminating enzyme